jgi:hypothetical protein
MAILSIDGHVHIYPWYDLRQTLRIGIENLKLSTTRFSTFLDNDLKNDSPEMIPIWLLTERMDCNFFKQTTASPNEFEVDGFKFLPGQEKEVIIVTHAGKTVLYILAGRQIVAKEGLEILSLISTFFLEDRDKTIDEVIKGVIDSGGIPAVNWAPGKWFFSRGKVVRRVIEEYAPQDLLIGDTTLRNTLWPMPKLMTAAQQRGFKIIAGSDPLPFDGEEKYIGSYGFCLRGDFKTHRPAETILSLLRTREKNISFIGKRNDIFSFCRRQYKIMTAK